jgi:hypothetical protein
VKEGGPVTLRTVESPIDPIRVVITEPALLRLDARGGLRVDLAISELLGAPSAQGGADPGLQERWRLESVEVEVTGRTSTERMKDEG